MSRTLLLHPATGRGTSVIVPIADRYTPLDALYEEFRGAFRDVGAFEFIFVVERHYRAAVESLVVLAEAGEPIVVVEVEHFASEATLIEAGAAHARFAVLAILPPYPRVAPEGIASMLETLRHGEVDLVTAARHPRRDPWLNRLQATLLRALLRHTVWVRFRDIASGVRIMRREVLEAIPLYGEYARFLPVLAVRAGFRVEEVPVAHHPEDHGLRVQRPGTYLRRVVDLVGLAFLVRFTRKPLRFFGLVGGLLAAVGAVTLAVVAAQRIAGRPLADRPLLLFGVLLVVLGTQSVGLGLIGELVVHFRASESRGYRLAADAPTADVSDESGTPGHRAG